MLGRNSNHNLWVSMQPKWVHCYDNHGRFATLKDSSLLSGFVVTLS